MSLVRKANKSQKFDHASLQLGVNVHAERDVLRANAVTHASELEQLRASLVKVTTERDQALTVGVTLSSVSLALA
jgi:hypothetical protein